MGTQMHLRDIHAIRTGPNPGTGRTVRHEWGHAIGEAAYSINQQSNAALRSLVGNGNMPPAAHINTVYHGPPRPIHSPTRISSITVPKSLATDTGVITPTARTQHQHPTTSTWPAGDTTSRMTSNAAMRLSQPLLPASCQLTTLGIGAASLNGNTLVCYGVLQENVLSST
jgi:hypothetical protein